MTNHFGKVPNDQRKKDLYQRALLLARITVFYNIVEGCVSVFFGLKDETISLFGFGIDSFVEVVSGVGIWRMLRRLRRHHFVESDIFERRALMITGTAFLILAFGLTVTAIMSFYLGHKPDTTFWGIVVSSLSILTMWALAYYKMKVGRELRSEAIVADAHCTRACLYLSISLLGASVGYELTGIGGIDAAGAVLIAWWSIKEGRESIERARALGASRS